MKSILSKIVAVIFLTVIASTNSYADKIRIALAETPSDELAAFFVALDRAKANGLDYEWTAFADEELAIQSILSGQMDIGFGTLIQQCKNQKHRLELYFNCQS